MRNVTTENFATDVLKSEQPVLVDFYADWCGPCQNQKQLLEELETEVLSDVEIVKVDVDQEQQLAIEYGVRSIPTLILFNGGEPVSTRVGLTPKQELTELLAQ